MVPKQVKKAIKKKKTKHTEELRSFEKISFNDSDQESFNSSSSEEGEVWKLGSGELFNCNNNHITTKLKYLNSEEQFFIYRLLKNMKTCLMAH